MRSRFFAILVLLLSSLLTETASFAQDKIFWAESVATGMGTFSRIRNANLDGSAPQDLAPTIPSSIGDLAVDSLNSKLYYIDSAGDRIVRINLDGSNLQIVQSALIDATGLALDAARQQVYWTNPVTGTISRCSFTPFSPIEVVLPSGASNALAVDLDVRAQKIYWTQTNGAVTRSNYNGSNLEPFDFVAGQKSAPFGIALERTLGQVFYSFPVSLAVGFIGVKSTNLLTPRSTFGVTQESHSINHLVVDPHPGGRVYWTHSLQGAVSSSFKNGTDEQLIVDGTSSRGIDLLLRCDSFSPDTDGDGTPDCLEQCALDPAKSVPGVCGCGVTDDDTDSDGVPDCFDQCPSDLNKSAPGVCGCGLQDIDSDTDGILDCSDLCPSDQNKSDPGVCGCGGFENLRTATQLTCDDAPLLDENTKITEGPQVFITFDADGNPVVRIVFARFAAARSIRLLKRRTRGPALLSAVLAASSKLKKLSLRYDARLRVQGAAKDYARYLVKRNELTLRNLKPGSYSVRYRALGNRDGKSVIRSNFSPLSFFTVP